MTWPPWAGRSLTDAFVFAAPAMFVFLWASGFIGGKLGLPYAEPMTFLAVRMFVVVLILGGIVVLTRPMQPARMDVVHAAITGFFVHGCYLGGVFVAIDHKLPAGFAALMVSLQPILTSMLANFLLGERVTPASMDRPRAWRGRRLSGGARSHRGERPAARLGGCDGRADRHDHRYALSEALRWRDRVAHRPAGAVHRRHVAIRRAGARL